MQKKLTDSQLASQPCYCGSLNSFQDCCQLLHNGSLRAKNAEQLMRSRYSAFCDKNSLYLLNTLAPNHRQPNEKIHIEQSFNQSQWLGLNIIAAQDKNIDHDAKTHTSWVDFVAFYKELSPTSNQTIQQLHERSNFIKIDNCWYYVDGKFLPAIKLNRNDKCFCGSHKKYKKCHGV